MFVMSFEKTKTFHFHMWWSKKRWWYERKIWNGSKLKLSSWRPFERLCKNLSILARYFLPKIQRYKMACILQHGMYQCLEQSLTYLLGIHSNRTLCITYWPISVQNWGKYLPYFTSFTHVVHHSPLILVDCVIPTFKPLTLAIGFGLF
jgi:hypothetical protein